MKSPVHRIRIWSQVVFLTFFFLLMWMASERWIGWHAVSFFLYADPLIAVGSALASRRLAAPLLLGVAVLLLTIVFGRFYCGWICPYGALHQFTGWAFARFSKRGKLAANAYRPLYALKYVILTAFLALAALGLLQIGLLDPIVLMTRAAATVILPGADDLLVRLGRTPIFSVRPRIHHQALVTGLLFFGFLSLNLWIPRFFCRALCPLGALLGVFARFSLFRIVRDRDRCDGCRLCQLECEGAADPMGDVRKAECYVCWKCIDACGKGALRYGFLPSDRDAVPAPDVQRRRLLGGLAAGLLIHPVLRAGGMGRGRPDPRRIRPPGSRPEPEFLERCVKCEECVRVCPTNGLQPALLEAGVEGVWTPVFDMRIGYCERNCVLCGQVCPTGAIRPISIEEKLGLGEYEGRPIRIGTAFFDRGRCLPWAMDTPCVVCEEVCPVSPKAIFTREVEVRTRSGAVVRLKRPYMDPGRCIGCGICEHSCPVEDRAAVRVTAVGESRAGGFLLPTGNES